MCVNIDKLKDFILDKFSSTPGAYFIVDLNDEWEICEENIDKLLGRILKAIKRGRLFEDELSNYDELIDEDGFGELELKIDSLNFGVEYWPIRSMEEYARVPELRHHADE